MAQTRRVGRQTAHVRSIAMRSHCSRCSASASAYGRSLAAGGVVCRGRREHASRQFQVVIYWCVKVMRTLSSGLTSATDPERYRWPNFRRAALRSSGLGRVALDHMLTSEARKIRPPTFVRRGEKQRYWVMLLHTIKVRRPLPSEGADRCLPDDIHHAYPNAFATLPARTKQ